MADLRQSYEQEWTFADDAECCGDQTFQCTTCGLPLIDTIARPGSGVHAVGLHCSEARCNNCGGRLACQFQKANYQATATA